MDAVQHSIARCTEMCIHQLIERQVEMTPDAIAVEFGASQLTYRELDQRANQLAHYLQRQGIGPDRCVAVCLERSLEMTVALLGVLKAGGAYVPLDPEYPRDRLALMVEETRPSVLLTQSKFATLDLGAVVATVMLDSEWATVAQESVERPVSGVTARNLAYIMYTSGSTGVPRGVLVEHRGVVNHNLAIATYLDLRPYDRVAQCTSIAFDISVEELFPTWMRGAAIVLHPPGVVGAGRDFTAWLRDTRISVVDLPTAFWHEWVAYLAHYDDVLSDALRLVIVGGQKASAQVLSTWNNLAGEQIRWVNGYGPTEATVASIFFSPNDPDEPPLSADDEIPIGRPIDGTAARILDAHGEPCAVEVIGELYIAGAGVARGYLNDAALTAKKFLPDPCSNLAGARMYRTGDLARTNRNGRIEFMGRVDDQVKVRGFRIELGEIEVTLRSHPDVHDVVVVARDDDRHDKQLAAYVVLKRTPTTGVTDLIAFLKTKLPVHMVPTSVTLLDALPLTPTGKTDKARLPAPRFTRESAGATFVAPSGDLEIALARIWSTVLGIEEIGAHDNFFELGGHSLRATQVTSRIRDVFGIDMPLSVTFASVTVADLAKAVAAHGGKTATRVVRSSISIAPRDRPLPLSFSQERVWFLQQLDPMSLAYNFQTLLCFAGPLDTTILRTCLNTLINRHEILRTTFCDTDGVPSQSVHSPFSVEMPIVDLRTIPPERRDAELQQHIQIETSTLFDMSLLPLIRWSLFRLDDDKFALLHIEHHLIHDGWSFNVFRRELLQLYHAYSTGVPSPLQPPLIQFADFAVWQRQWLSGDELTRQLEYWTAQLHDASVLELPTDRARPPVQSFQGAVHEFELSDEVYAALRELSDRVGATLFHTLEAVFLTLLHRYSGQEDLCIGSGIANRRWTETEDLLGMLVNNVVLRSVLRENLSFRTFLADVRKTAIQAFAHQDAPFDHVVRAVNPRTDASRNPLFQVMFSFHDSPLDEPTIPGIEFSCVELISNRSAKFDLNVVAVPHAEQRSKRDRQYNRSGVTFLWEYNTALFDLATVEQMAAHFRALVNAVIANPDTRIHDLEMLHASERAMLLSEWNHTHVAYPDHTTIHRRFEEQVEATPDAAALVSGDDRLTYAQLNARANQLAHRLRFDGVGLGVMVGICMGRSVDMIVSTLAILKVGGAYVPLDPGYPDERLSFIAQETDVRILLTDTANRAKCAPWGRPMICVDAERTQLAANPSTNTECSTGPNDLAYVMYTSGSTGRPKGVAVPHRGVLRLLFGIDFAELNRQQRILQMASLSFDSSNFEIWGALLHGGTCVLYAGHLPSPHELGDVLRAHAINTLWLTSSMFNSVIDSAPEALAGVRQLLVGGEALSVPHVLRAQELLPNTTIINGYGPTESTTFACCHRMLQPLAVSSRSVPIGRPIANTEVYLLDAYRQPVPVGVVGELYIAGDGLARGYVGHPALTAERFIPNPFGSTGSRMYRTGDFARYRRDGLIEFIGRRDDQVQLRGYRIELGEIENVIRQQAGIRDVAVVVRENVRGEQTLVAYVVAKPEGAFNADAMRENLRLTLPAYMIPSRVVVLESLPLSPTGKVNRTLLPSPYDDVGNPGRPFISATTNIEQAVAAIWRDVLQIEQISSDANFFDLGGHSMLATRIVARIRTELLVDLPLRALFEHPTVADLTLRISAEASNQFRDRRAPSPWRYLFLLKPGTGDRSIFFLPGGFGGDYEFLVYARLVHFVGEGFTFYGLRARSADGVESAHASVEAMVADYLDEIRAVQPRGPYRLVGNCIGGVVAFELARQLEREGEQVHTLVMMDTEFPTRQRFLRELRRGILRRLSARWNLNYYLDRVVHHWQVTRVLDWKHRWSYLVHKMRLAFDATPVPGCVVDPADLVRAGYVGTLRRYQPTAYHGSVDMIASERENTDPAAGWSDIVRGEINVHVVPGDHESYIRDFVKDAALQLKVCLDR